jgi:DNA-directed RNA polymerase subunit RPC12/RpoP
MIVRDRCPQCDSKRFKKNGRLPSGKQSYCCNACGRQFVVDFEQRIVPDEYRPLIKRLLRERLSPHGICRAVGVGMKWLMGLVVDCYESAPDDLNVQLPDCPKNVIFYRLKAEADEPQSFVCKKKTSNGCGSRLTVERARH